MGRHGNSQEFVSGRRGLTAGIAALVVVGAAATATYALTRDGDEPDTTAQSTSQSVPSEESSSDTSSATTSESTTVDTSACRAEVAAAEDVVTAVAASAKSWREHTQAQLKLDAGTFTRDQTLAVWGTSKARGADDLAKYAKATAAADKVDGACAELESTEDADAADCVARRDALAAANADGKVIRDQWADHQEMMANKDDMVAEPGGGEHYADMWATMVKDSVGNFKDYDASLDALESAPACA